MRKRHPNFIDRTGEVRFNTYGCRMTIIRYESKRDCDIQFDNGYIAYNMNYDHFKKGKIKNPLHPNTQGVGYIGIGDYEYHPNHPICYEKWQSMFKRCYNEEFHRRQPNYRECEVDINWHNYQNFAEWFHSKWKDFMDRSWQLDKDLYCKNNKLYSDKTCYLLPDFINSMLSVKKKVSGKYPTGVVKDCTKYHVSIRINGERTRSKLCDTIEEASVLYYELKQNEIKRVAEVNKDKLEIEAYQKLLIYKFN